MENIAKDRGKSTIAGNSGAVGVGIGDAVIVCVGNGVGAMVGC